MEGEFSLLALALVMLVLVWGGLWRWAARRAAPSDRAAVAVVALAAAGGLLGAPFWAMAAPASFAVALPPLAFRMLAAAGLAFGALGLAVLARPEPARLRLLLAMLAAYLWPLIGAILLLHRDRLDPGAAITWAFLVVAGGLGLAALWQMRTTPAPPGGVPAQGAVGAVLRLAAGLLGLWALALLATPAGPVPAIWAWPADPLAGRLVGTMLLALALGAAMALRRADLSGPVTLALALYGAGAVAAALAQAAAGRPVPWAYALGLGGMGLAAALVVAGAARGWRRPL